jgi:hypothetical protein
MITHLKSIPTTDKILLAAYPTCLLAFALPAIRISMGGRSFSQYLLTGYTGWVAFGVILVLAIIQAIVFFRKKRILKWLGLVAGGYAMWFSVRLIYESYALGQSSGPDNLAGSLQFSARPMIGLFLLALAGGVLFALSLAKTTDRRLT